MINLKRTYQKPHPSDGFRILVDRLWPRGLTKDKARIDLWLKEIAPSDALRKWFSHDPQKWNEFKQRYRSELKAHIQLVNQIKQLEKEKGTVTLLYSAKNEFHNNAVILAHELAKK